MGYRVYRRLQKFGVEIYFNYKIISRGMSSKSPIKDYSRLLGVERTVKKEENFSRLYQFDTSERIGQELRLKLELSLKHNAKLLDQNAALSELVSRLRSQVKQLNEQLNLLSAAEVTNIAKIQQERAHLMDELQVKQFSHESEVKRLLEEVSRLHAEKNDLEMVKNKELEKYKLEHERNMSGCIQSIRSSHSNAKDIYETQIAKLKETIEAAERDLDATKVEHKLQTGRLQQTVNAMEAEINHLKKIQALELQEVRNALKTELHRERRTLERDNEIAESNHQLSLKKLRNELREKNDEISAISKKMANNEEMHSVELEHLKREKEELLSEISTAEVTQANNLTREKAKLRQINEQEVKNILQLNETHIGELRNEINHIKNLLDCKSNEIRRLYEENGKAKKSMEAELELQNKVNEELRVRMKALQRDNLEAMEAFKIKMAQLIDADMKALCSYYQNEVALLQTNVNTLEDINRNNKEKLYKALQDNDQIRKNFQIQVSKQKARVQDLKIKLASLNLEHKEQVTSLATKMELTSQTLVREADQKNKSQAFFEEQKKKFHSLSNSKDKEIADLLDTMQRMKKMHEGEIAVLRNQKKELRDQIQAADDRMGAIKQQFEDQMKRREEKFKSEKKPDDQKEKQILKQLYDKNEKIETQNIKLNKQVEHLARQNRALAGQLGLKKGFIETLQLESCAAIEDEKSKLRIMMGNNEVSMKEYFEEKIASREKDIEHLQTVLAGKEQDIRDLIVRYNGLEKRMETLLASQEKLRDLEEKVKNLGLDNNLVKNMAELFNRPQPRPVQ